MFNLLRLFIGAILRLFSSRQALLLENLALRQQLAVFKRKNKRPRLNALDRLFWIAAKKLCSAWKDSLLLVTPTTVVRWHRAGFRLYWKLLSQRKPGRKPTAKQIRTLIARMMAENPTWGAPHIHGELLKLGFGISESTVSRCMARIPRRPESAKHWLAFLHNHREAITAMDFFTVPTIPFGTLYCFFIIAHDRRRILHLNVTSHPTSAWVAQQLRETFPYEHRYRHLLFDRDAKFGAQVAAAIEAVGLTAMRTAVCSPWQNGIAERWVGSCRRDLLDHVIPLNERHLKRLLSEYLAYYHGDRCHLGLAKDTPSGRSVTKAEVGSKIIVLPRLGGLHHRYDVAA